MSSLSVPYVLGGTLTEQQRLIVQARGLEPHARALLDQIAIAPGARVADVGCGPIGIMDLLSERVGPDGLVVGVEREARFVDMARSELKLRGVRNAEVVHADALKIGLEHNSFDFVHARLMLINLPVATQRALLTEMLALVRPGGIIALQEYDAISYACYPEHPSWQVLLGVYNEAFHAAGGNEYVGRSLAGLLRSAGAHDVELLARVGFPKVGDYQRTHLLSLIGSMRERILASGRISELVLTEHMDTLGAHLSDPATTLVDKLLIQVWARKPA